MSIVRAIALGGVAEPPEDRRRAWEQELASLEDAHLHAVHDGLAVRLVGAAPGCPGCERKAELRRLLGLPAPPPADGAILLPVRTCVGTTSDDPLPAAVRARYHDGPTADD